MMFDQIDPIRFAMWNFVRDASGNPDPHSPAWDWQYVVHEPELDKWYGYKARVQCLPISSPDDVLDAYRRWREG